MKKKIIFALAVLALAAGGFTYFSHNAVAEVKKEEVGGIHWYTLEEAQKLSDANPRKIFLDISTSWCGWCKTMDANTFHNATIAKYMDDTYYCVKFDAETRDTVVFNGQKFWNRGPANQRSANDFANTVLQGRLSYPSFAFISKDRQTFSIMQGYMPPEQFEPYLHYYGEEKEKTMSYDEFTKVFKSQLPPADPNQKTAPAPAPH